MDLRKIYTQNRWWFVRKNSPIHAITEVKKIVDNKLTFIENSPTWLINLSCWNWIRNVYEIKEKRGMWCDDNLSVNSVQRVGYMCHVDVISKTIKIQSYHRTRFIFCSCMSESWLEKIGALQKIGATLEWGKKITKLKYVCTIDSW